MIQVVKHELVFLIQAKLDQLHQPRQLPAAGCMQCFMNLSWEK